MQVLAPSVPTSNLLLFSLLLTATSSPVSVGVISKHHVGNMQYKYRVLISPLHGAGSSNPGVMLSPPQQPTPCHPSALPACSQASSSCLRAPWGSGERTCERAVSWPHAEACMGHTPLAQHKGTHGAIARCSGDGGTPFCPSSRPVPPCPEPGWQHQEAGLSTVVLPPRRPAHMPAQRSCLHSGGHVQRQVLLSACGGSHAEACVC